MRASCSWVVLVSLVVLTACGPSEEKCPAGATDCAGTCRDLTGDPQSCGACGVACESWQTCAGGACVSASVCGNGRVEGTESCDDGNTQNDDGCLSTCKIQPGYACAGAPSVCTPHCGDGKTAGAEACDDGNSASGDGCSYACAVETGYACHGTPSICDTLCGDGVIVGDEGCDDGNTADGDGCSATCEVETHYSCSGSPSTCTGLCGDGLLIGAEPCDDGNTLSADGCSAGCNVEPGFTCVGEPSVCHTTCGDGVVAGAEPCDDGNTVDGDGCSATCTVEPGSVCTGQTPSVCTAICGDGIVLGSEGCDDGNLVNTDGCSNTCTVQPGYQCSGEPSVCVAVCGDAIVAGTEACDDGNAVDGDGCSVTCEQEPGYGCSGSPSVCAPVCGDGIMLGAEVCDDGNATGGDGCSAACAVELGFTCAGTPSVCASTCGDGLKASNEGCDDGALVAGDGCSATCTVEPGYLCFGSPSQCLTGVSEVEPNDDGAVAIGVDDFSVAAAQGPFSTDVVISGAISPAGDDDGFALSNPGLAPVGVRVEVWDPALGIGVSCGANGVDTQLRIRDAGGVDLVGSVDRGWADYCSSVDYVIPAGQTVYAHLSSYQDQSAIGAYLLQVRFSACGNGIAEAGEQCDDANTLSGDGCSATCQYEAAAPTGFACAPGQTLVQLSATDVPLAIPDPNSSTGQLQPVTSRVNVPNAGTIARVMVGIDSISHTWVSDLAIALTAPSGRTGWLVWNEGGSGANFTGTDLDDNCAAAPGLGSIAGQSAPFTGCFAPKEELAPFRGESSSGTWTLHLIDYYRPDMGTLNGWKIGLCLQ